MKIAVFCGASSGYDEVYTTAAKELGKLMAEQGHSLVFGGGHTGLMGAIADSVLEHGGQAFGVMPHSLVRKEVAHQGLTELFIVEDMHQRKAKMSSLADAFVAIPGGIGTLEEIFEAWTWAYLDYHDKPTIFMNVEGYFDKLIEFLDHMQDQGFVKSYSRSLINITNTPQSTLQLCKDLSSN